jgi:ribonuclease Z
MKLHCLGTTGYHPNERRHTACYWLSEAGIVLDAGTAMFRLIEQPLGKTLDIFLTHAHLDHVVGLTFLLDVLYKRDMDSVRVHGSAKTLNAVRSHLFAEEIFPVTLPVEWCVLGDCAKLPHGGTLTSFPLTHPGASLGFRLDWPGHSMAYVTDTSSRGADSAYVEKIRGVDLLLHEANFADGVEEFAEKTGHSCTSQAAEAAKAAGVQRLVLIHVFPRSPLLDPINVAAAQAIFPRTEVATDGMILEF